MGVLLCMRRVEIISVTTALQQFVSFRSLRFPASTLLKLVNDFPVPSRESLVSDIPAGDGENR
jgi:hypothetical protein